MILPLWFLNLRKRSAFPFCRMIFVSRSPLKSDFFFACPPLRCTIFSTRICSSIFFFFFFFYRVFVCGCSRGFFFFLSNVLYVLGVVPCIFWYVTCFLFLAASLVYVFLPEFYRLFRFVFPLSINKIVPPPFGNLVSLFFIN